MRVRKYRLQEKQTLLYLSTNELAVL